MRKKLFKNSLFKIATDSDGMGLVYRFLPTNTHNTLVLPNKLLTKILKTSYLSYSQVFHEKQSKIIKRLPNPHCSYDFLKILQPKMILNNSDNYYKFKMELR